MLQAKVQEVAKRVKVCTLKTGAWRPTRLHKGETAALAAKHGNNYGKAVVTHCDHPALLALEKLHNEAYKWHVTHTRPSVDDGVRIIPVALEVEHMKAMGSFEQRHRALEAEFMADYPNLMAEAPNRLNGYYDPDIWRAPEVIKAKFKFDVSYRPCPTEGEWQDWLSVSVTAAQAELTEQLEDAIKRVAERCAAEKGRLYETVFSNLKELLDLVPHLNLANDPKIAAIAKRAEALADVDKDALVKEPSRRKMVAAQANAIVAMFNPSVPPLPVPVEPVEAVEPDQPDVQPLPRSPEVQERMNDMREAINSMF